MAYNRFPLVSVITLTYNRQERLRNLLGALREQDYRPFEVILVDNASTDGTVALVTAEFPEVCIIRSQENYGNFSYNLGVEAAQGDYLLMIDDDGLPAATDWISQVVDRFEANPNLGVIACTIRMPDTGRIAMDSPQFIPDGDPICGYSAVAYNGTGAGLRAAAVKLVMPIYPNRHFRSWIELYLCTNLLRTGWEVRCFPEIEVWHCRPSLSSNPPAAYFGLRNYPWYVIKFYPGPLIPGELLHYLGSRFKLALQGQIPLRVLLRALRDCISDLPEALRSRTPIDKRLAARLRAVRQLGNWHKIAPEIIPFPGAEVDAKEPACG
jgi:GT2 family glycosyltransferase